MYKKNVFRILPRANNGGASCVCCVQVKPEQFSKQQWRGKARPFDPEAAGCSWISAEALEVTPSPEEAFR